MPQIIMTYIAQLQYVFALDLIHVDKFIICYLIICCFATLLKSHFGIGVLL